MDCSVVFVRTTDRKYTHAPGPQTGEKNEKLKKLWLIELHATVRAAQCELRNNILLF